jgi:site-specific recombinase XerC
MLTAGRDSENINDFALVAMLGLLGLRIFEAACANIEELSEVHGHRVLRVHGKGDKIALVPLPPAVGRAIDRAIEDRGGDRCSEAAPAIAWTVTVRPDVSVASRGRLASPPSACIPTCSGTRS